MWVNVLGGGVELVVVEVRLLAPQKKALGNFEADRIRDPPPPPRRRRRRQHASTRNPHYHASYAL